MRMIDQSRAPRRVVLPVFVLVLFFMPFFLLAQDQEDTEEYADEFVVNFLSGAIQLNPIYSYTTSEAQIYTGIYEGLVNYHPLTMEPVPAAAERWEVSPDGRVYTFYIREDAMYWNGDPVTAEDFRETWLTLIDPEIEAAYNFLYDVIEGVREYRQGGSIDDVGIRVLGEKTLEVTLRRPATHFLKILCHHAFVPVHRSVRQLEDWSELNTVPGNGPYFVTERDDEHLLLERNELYWDARSVAIPRIRVIFADAEDDTITTRFNRGEIDWVTAGMNLGEVQFPNTIVVNPLFATTYYFLRSDQEPFSDPRVRRALALLLPWEQLRDEEILYIPAYTLVPQIPFYPAAESITERSEDEAMQLLEEAGYRRGVRLPTITVHVPQGSEPQRVAELMRDSWEDALEVNVEIQVTPYPAYFDLLGDSDFTVGTVSWIGDFADPLTFLQMWISDSNVNDAGFSDLTYDELIDESMLQSGVQRYQTLAQAEEILLQSGTVLPVSHSPSINLIDLQEIDGWYPNPLDIHPFKYFEFSGRAPVPGAVRFDGAAPGLPRSAEPRS